MCSGLWMCGVQRFLQSFHVQAQARLIFVAMRQRNRRVCCDSAKKKKEHKRLLCVPAWSQPAACNLSMATAHLYHCSSERNKARYVCKLSHLSWDQAIVRYICELAWTEKRNYWCYIATNMRYMQFTITGLIQSISSNKERSFLRLDSAAVRLL